MSAARHYGYVMTGRRKLGGEVAADRAGAEDTDAQGSPPDGSGRRLPCFADRFYCFFVESLGWLLDELEPADEDEGDDGELVLPLPADDEGDDGAGAVDGLLLLELDDDGDDGELMLPLPEVEPEVEPAPLRSAPRSQAAIRLAPRATETATARVDNFM
jgi:hypothetical protein